MADFTKQTRKISPNLLLRRFESNFNATGNKIHGNAVDVIATLVAYVIIFVKMYVINAKDCKNTPSVMTYAFGNYIHAEA